MSESTKDGNVILRSISVPDRVEPGETFQAEALVSNGAAWIGPFDPDFCDSNDGYRLSVVFEGPEGQRQVDGPKCHGLTAVRSKDETYSATFTAPQTGTATVEAFVRLPGSGKETGTVADSATVSATAGREPDTGDDSEDDSNECPPWNPNCNSSDAGIGGAANAVFLLILLAILAWLADSGADLAGG